MPIRHRDEFIHHYRRPPRTSWLGKQNEKLCAWLTHHVLPSLLMFDIALAVPVCTITAPDWIKVGIVLVGSNWVQWWALPALQRSSNEIQARQDAQADANHQTQTHIAAQVDKILDRLGP